MKRTVQQVGDLTRRIAPILSGQSPPIIGGALAQLLASWLAGHVVVDDQKATDSLRSDLLDMHFEAVLSLIPMNERNPS